MSKRQVLILLGIWIAVFLFLGFPSSGDKIISLVSGILIIWIAFRMRPAAPMEAAERMPYVEHKNQASDPETPTDTAIINNPPQPNP